MTAPTDERATTWPRRLVLLLAMILVAGFAARLGTRMVFGEDDFWHNGYTLFYRAAKNLIDGNGFCNGTFCARPPIYVSFLALATYGGQNYLLVIIPQALLGAGTALCAFLIGRHIFNSCVGVIACAMTAVYPYYVMHDTALQETGMVTFATALAVWLLLRANRDQRDRAWIMAGIALAAAVLVRASMAPSIAAALLWALVWGATGTIGNRLRVTAILAVTALATLLPWLVYTYRVTGAPVISTDTGYVLWAGNNPDTFARYPAGSIDRSSDLAHSHLTPQDRDERRQLAGSAIAIGNWYRHRAIDFIAAHPWEILQRALHKLEAGFSWRLNPHREPLAQWAYAAGYVPVAVLGLIGMVLARRRPETALIALFYLAFMAVTAVFWAHTSHRVYLDVYWIVFAASVIVRAGTYVFPAGNCLVLTGTDRPSK